MPGKKVPWANLLFSRTCLHGCQDTMDATFTSTRVWNSSDRPVELQIRVGSVLKKGHILKPGSSKRLKCKAIYRAHMPGTAGGGGPGTRSLLYYYDETCQPYVWIHDSVGHFTSTRVVKQQYISLEDLRDSSEIRILRDHHKGCISVRKKSRPEVC